MIRVAVADDHHLVRSGIKALLEKADDIQVVGEADDGQQAVELVQQLEPDVLVMDVAMPRMNGTEATARIRALNCDTKIVILSMHSDETLIREALRNGASGYLLKRSVTEELLLAVRAANRGQIYLSPVISQSIVEDFLTHREVKYTSGFHQLTPREREVLQLVAEGYTNNGIAEALNISVKTVEKHRSSLMTKLDAHDVASLTRIAIKYKLVFIE
ncbi:MAG: response regulator transcription factor [Anaerolineales bacterium]|nr:response regulator transcription factor [Anaerolineales bacterium]